MPFDNILADRIRTALLTLPVPVQKEISEKRMFGGLAFLLKGKMTVGIIGNELVVRVKEEKMSELLKSPWVRPMDFTKKPMKEFIFVSSEAFENGEQLLDWISLGIEHARYKLNL